MHKPKTVSVLLVLICLTHYSMADGGVVVKTKQYVYEPNQKAIIVWDGDEEKLILSTEIKTDKLADMAWLIPVESRLKPEVEESDIGLFTEFAQVLRRDAGEYLGRELSAGGGGVEPKRGVVVIEERAVDIYDIIILQASDVGSLKTWLLERGYLISEGAEEVFRHYCNPNGYFIIQKIDLKNLYRSEIKKINDIEKRDVFKEPLDDRVIDKVCSYSTDEFCSVLTDLKAGLATPLMITFWPDKPTYPLKISSINEGGTKIEVYMASKKEMFDSSGILTEQVVTYPSFLSFKKPTYEKLGINKNPVLTLFTYQGQLSKLDRDAVFEECVECHGTGYVSDDIYWEIYEFDPLHINDINFDLDLHPMFPYTNDLCPMCQICYVLPTLTIPFFLIVVGLLYLIRKKRKREPGSFKKSLLKLLLFTPLLIIVSLFLYLVLLHPLPFNLSPITAPIFLIVAGLFYLIWKRKKGEPVSFKKLLLFLLLYLLMILFFYFIIFFLFGILASLREPPIPLEMYPQVFIYITVGSIKIFIHFFTDALTKNCSYSCFV